MFVLLHYTSTHYSPLQPKKNLLKLKKAASNYNKASSTRHSWRLSLSDNSENQEFKFLYQYGSSNPWVEQLSLLADGELQVKKIRFPDGSLQTTAGSGGPGDNWGTQNVVTEARLTGNGDETPLDIAQQGATSGQVLKWNGSAWAPANDVGGGNGDNWGTQVVISDATLSGDGTTSSPLSVVNGGGGTSLWSESGNHIYYDSGNVNVGSNSYVRNLNVHGTIFAKEVNVTTSVPFPDFVFKEDYDLLSLNKVDQFIKENGHLPDIPSEAEVLKNGISLGEMQAKLLQKIEELTLYVIELDKKNKQLEAMINY